MSHKESLNETIKMIIDDQVSYYWEYYADDSSPCMEVFTYGNRENTIVLRNMVERIIRAKGIDQFQASIDYEELEVREGYFRIMIYFDPEMSKEKIQEMADVLKSFGTNEYKMI